MATFVFNEGYGHRGVWHLADSVTEIKVAPREHESSHDVMDYHTDSCEAQFGKYNRETQRREVDPVDCICGHTGQPTGEVSTHIFKFPETVTYVVPTVYCKQVDRLRGGDSWKESIPWNRRWNKPGVFVIEHTRNPRKFLLEADDFPPGPTCSRCRKGLNG